MQIDVLVIGGNPGGCAAAILAARAGRSVLLLEASPVLGGMNANGAMGFDCATPQALSGIAEEVASRIRAYYVAIGLDDPLFYQREDLVWESHVAAKIWRELADETAGLQVLVRAVPTAVRMAGERIDEVIWHAATDLMGNVDDTGPGHSVQARLVVDASYEGDVSAWAGVPFRLGREARSPLEPHAGKIYFSNFDTAPAQGYLAHSILPGSTGEADNAIMAFASRLHCRIYSDTSEAAAHRIKSPPPGYDASLYAWGPVATDAAGNPVFFNTLYVLVNGKVLLNRMVRGNNLVGPNRDYVLAHPRDRKALRQLFVDRALGYLYYIQTEGGMPGLGLAHDEFTDNGHVPYLIYVREARRIEGLVTLTEADVNPCITGDGFRPPAKPDAVAIGDWTYESQGCADEAPDGYHYPDGYITGRATRAPFQIPYGCLVPSRVDNLLVCGAISSTHIAMGATRCEGARIQLGIAAGLAAAECLALGVAPRHLPVEGLQQAIIQRGGKLVYFTDVESSHADFPAIQWAAQRGFVPHDADLCFRPDDAVTWGDCVTAVVTCLRIPVSVTGLHFEGLTARDACFRYAETLYDLGSRAGVDLFGLCRLVNEDAMKEFLRLYPQHKLLPCKPGRPISRPDAQELLQGVAHCLGAAQAFRPRPESGGPVIPITRAQLCTELRALDAQASAKQPQR